MGVHGLLLNEGCEPCVSQHEEFWLCGENGVRGLYAETGWGNVRQ